jgi:hypothetical protein
MAAVRTLGGPTVLACLALAACGKPVGLDSTAFPLARIHVLVTGELAAIPGVDAGEALDGGDALDAGQIVDAGGSIDAGAMPTQLHAALVWGLQWVPDPFCVLPPVSPAAAAVIAAGCRDSFGFVPNSVAADTPITLGVPAILELYTLPRAEVMVGDVTARVAYASVIVYDDRNGNGILDLRHPARQRRGGGEVPNDASGAADRVWGASFISMTLPDRRVAFREGNFNQNVAFYPRRGCADPPKQFSILSASGFSEAAALLSLLTGQLPIESDLGACATAGLDDTIVIPLQDPTGLSQLACTTNDQGGVTYYRRAPDQPPVPLTDPTWTWACTSFPRLPGDTGGATGGGQQLVLASDPRAPCRSNLHYTLRGCDNNPFCASPTWDLAAPPWWPCSTTP